MRAPALILSAFLISLQLACSRSEEAPLSALPTPGSSPALSADEAVEAALENARHITWNQVPQETAAEFTTFGGALTAKGLTHPIVSPFRPLDDTPTWVVTLKGYFYEPQGPPDPGGPATPQQPVCGEIIVLVEDSTANYLALTFRRLDPCS